MLKYYQFRPTVKYVTTPYTPKIIIKKFIKYKKRKSNNTGNLPFKALLFPSSYIDIESTNTVFSNLMSSFLRLFKKPEERKAKNTSFLTPSKNI